MKRFLILGAAVMLVSNAQAQQDWYSFQPANDTEPSVIGLEDWLEKPAGKHGRIVRQDDNLVYNGQPIKLWGLNLCCGTCAPEKALADKRAAFYPKFGINTVRLHKFADGAGWSDIQSTGLKEQIPSSKKQIPSSNVGTNYDTNYAHNINHRQPEDWRTPVMQRRDFLTKILAAGGAFAALPWLKTLGAETAEAKTPGARPNIVLVMVDDMGYSDIGCFGAEMLKTLVDQWKT